MFRYTREIIAAVVLGFAVSGSAMGQAPFFTIQEIFSNADGSVQFIVMSSDSTRLTGRVLVASDGTTTRSFTFPNDLPEGAVNHPFLVATQGFAALGLVRPDYVIPDGFLFHPTGIVSAGFLPQGHGPTAYLLPADGILALWLDHDGDGFVTSRAENAVARNAAGESYTFASEILDRWFVREIYSNADGSVQFVKVEIDFAVQPQTKLAGKTLVASNGSMERSFTFTRDLDCVLCTGGDSISFIVGTQGFAELQPGVSDFVVPNGFLFTPKGSLKFDTSDEIHYEALPTDGRHALYPHGFAWGDGGQPVVGTPVAAGAFMPGSNPVVEFRNAPDTAYFRTAYPTEIAMLDAGRAPGWERTGDTFNAWTAAFSVNAGARPPPGLLPVCRVYLGDSHFYSISPAECETAAQHPAFLETAAAFFATLPDDATGRCPADQSPLYRSWNPRRSTHRYTTQRADFDFHVDELGWLSEGHGVTGAYICVGGGTP